MSVCRRALKSNRKATIGRVRKGNSKVCRTDHWIFGKHCRIRLEIQKWQVSRMKYWEARVNLRDTVMSGLIIGLSPIAFLRTYLHLLHPILTIFLLIHQFEINFISHIPFPSLTYRDPMMNWFIFTATIDSSFAIKLVGNDCVDMQYWNEGSNFDKIGQTIHFKLCPDYVFNQLQWCIRV